MKNQDQDTPSPRRGETPGRGPLDSVYFDLELPSGRPYQIVGFGLNAVDWICALPRYPEHNSKIRIDAMYRLGGGQTATACAMCARYGLRVRYVGRVGDDEIGEFSLQDLKREKMDLQVEVIPQAFSQYAIILVDRPTGERTILWDRDPRLDYKEGELCRDLIVQGQILHLDGHDQAAAIEAAAWAREAGMKVTLDIDKTQPGVEKLLERVDFLLPSQNFIQSFTGRKDWRDALLALAREVSGFVAVTRGREGSAAVWEGEVVEVPGFPVAPVDTTGAGDVFHGGFLYGLVQNWSAGHCLRFANAAGALSCRRFGARDGIPALEEVLGLMGELQDRPRSEKLLR